MSTLVIASAVTLFFSSLLTVSGVGAAFIIIPVLIALGVEVHTAMASALLLNAVAMAFASIRFFSHKLIDLKVAIPMAIFGSLSAPVCAFISNFIPRGMLLWVFVAFCIFAGLVMFKKDPVKINLSEKLDRLLWPGLGFTSGTGGGFLGVGGGNLLVAMLIIFGFEPKKSSATTSFIVIFVCLAGFGGHLIANQLGYLDTVLAPGSMLAATGTSAIVGAVIGSWLLTDKLSSVQVKRTVGVVLIGIAGKVMYDILTR